MSAFLLSYFLTLYTLFSRIFGIIVEGVGNHHVFLYNLYREKKNGKNGDFSKNNRTPGRCAGMRLIRKNYRSPKLNPT